MTARKKALFSTLDAVPNPEALPKRPMTADQQSDPVTATAEAVADDTVNLTEDDIEGLDSASDKSPWDDYPIDTLHINTENRSIYEVIRRINEHRYILDPDFQRDFIWPVEKQSKLIESVLMRIPLPVFYFAENDDGRVVVVDGLQRLTTFKKFVDGESVLHLPEREELHGKTFRQLPFKYQNRIEDFNLTLYTIDSKVPERARLDIFERVNSGIPLTRQQMRNSLFMGPGTKFLKIEADTGIFRSATGGSLKKSTMRDREFVNRFCAFKLLQIIRYNGDMDEFLANALKHMNKIGQWELDTLSREFRLSMKNNLEIFGRHAFRKHDGNTDRRSVLNAAIWDVMSTGLSRYEFANVVEKRDLLFERTINLLNDYDFRDNITLGTNSLRKVEARFHAVNLMLGEVFND